MEPLSTSDWANIYIAILLCISVALFALVALLSNGPRRPAGLGLFSVYFMAGLLGSLVFGLQYSTGGELALEIAVIATLLNSIVLLLALCQRAGLTRRRYAWSGLALLAVFSGFWLSADKVFLVHNGAIGALLAAVAMVSLYHARNAGNAGDVILACAGAIGVLGTLSASMLLLNKQDSSLAQAVVFGSLGAVYALVACGFLSAVLLDYRRQLGELVVRDPLTRLLNARGLRKALEVTLANAARMQHNTATLLMNIDHFAQINDSFGQDCGDALLGQLAVILSDECRGSDVIAATGPGEFVVVLPETELSMARRVAERLREGVAQDPLVVKQQTVNLTVSVGVTACQGSVDLDAEIEKARRALALAKRGGRNQVASVDHSPVTLTSRRREG